MHRFSRQFITEWRRLKLPVSGGKLIAAVSGGADSCAMLLALDELLRRKKLDLSLTVAHLNHQIRGEDAAADESFVQGLAERLGIGFVSERVILRSGGNLEQNARDARYDFLRRTALEQGAFGVVTGHTLDDQAETFLMNLIRGSGPDGLVAMQAVRRMENGVELLRPMLGWARRSETEEFCREREIAFRSDPMNEDEAFRRVWIRRRVLPLLAEANPRIVEGIAATAALMAGPRATAPIHESLSLKELRAMDSNARLTQIRLWLTRHRGNTRSLGLKHIQAVEQLALSEKSGKVAELPGNCIVVRSGGKLAYQRK